MKKSEAIEKTIVELRQRYREDPCCEWEMANRIIDSLDAVFDPEEPNAVEEFMSACDYKTTYDVLAVKGKAAIAQLQARNLELAVECEKKDARIAALEKAQR